VPCQPRPWRPTTTQPGAGGQTIPDLVGRDFTADAPGIKLVGDITYLPTWQGFSYLATVIDCCTRECIGYAIADHMRAELVIDALRMARVRLRSARRRAHRCPPAATSRPARSRSPPGSAPHRDCRTTVGG
jgi:transposase InsO family protein